VWAWYGNASTETSPSLERAQAVPALLPVGPVAIRPVLRGRVRHDQTEAVAVKIPALALFRSTSSAFSFPAMVPSGRNRPPNLRSQGLQVQR